MKLMRLITLAGILAAVAVPVCAGEGVAEAVELYPIVQEGKWGFMDKAGKVVIRPQYECAWDFTDGLFAGFVLWNWPCSSTPSACGPAQTASTPSRNECYRRGAEHCCTTPASGPHPVAKTIIPSVKSHLHFA